MPKLAWVPFYMDDFTGSRVVRNMTRLEVGVFIDVLCLLWQSGGYALDTAGQTMSLQAIAEEVCRRGEDPADIERCIADLLRKGALARDEQGRICSPKAVEVCEKQAEKSEKAKEAINRRWQALRDGSTPDNDRNTTEPPDSYGRNTDVIRTYPPSTYPSDTTQSSELRTQNTDLTSIVPLPGYSSLDTSSDPPEVLIPEVVDDVQEKVPIQAIVEAYHAACCPPMPKVVKLTPNRKALIKARWHEDKERQSLQWWERFFVYCSQSTFLMGEQEGRDDRPPFMADLEWLVRPGNIVKVLEGKYHREAVRHLSRFERVAIKNAETVRKVREEMSNGEER